MKVASQAFLSAGLGVTSGVTPGDLAPEPADRRMPKVVFICGAFRSGSTLLEAMLGEFPGYYSGGELRSLWENGLARGHLCGCGEPVATCDFWQSVQQRAFAPSPPPPADAVIALQQRHIRLRPRQLASALGSGAPSIESPAATYVRILTELYVALQEETEATVVVDSSKAPLDFLLLAALSNLELYLVHLVRDPRGVAHSWSRIKKIPRRGDTADESRIAHVPRRGPLAASVHWLIYNGASDLLLRRQVGRRYLRLRYEDYMDDPKGSLAAVCRFVGEERGQFPFLRGNTVRLRRRHRIVGNPGLLSADKVGIRVDDEWKTGMALGAKFAVGVTTAPLARRYGYRLWEGDTR